MWSSGAFGYLLDYLLWWALLGSLLVHAWCFFRFFPRPTRPKTALIAGNLLVFSCLLAFAAIVGESYFRFFSAATDSFGVSLPARKWFAIYTELNSLGFRDREWSPQKPAGVRRIAFVGDSFTYGWGIERPEDRFTNLIGSEFSRRSAPVEVMNVAKAGWGTGDQVAAVQRLVADFQVDEIVLCYVPNDIEKLLPRTAAFDPIRPPEPVWFDPDRSALLDYLYRRIWVPRVATVRHYHDWLADGFADPAVWQQHQRQLGAISQIAKDSGVRVRAVLLPFLRTAGEKFDADSLHQTLARFFEANEVPVLDLWPVAATRPSAELVVNSADAHPNEIAHRLFAEAIWKAFYAAGD